MRNRNKTAAAAVTANAIATGRIRLERRHMLPVLFGIALS
jgi:hypothetical protein